MNYISIKTRIMRPPQDDLYAVLTDSLTDVQEKDVLLITSKVVAIHEERCVPVEGTDKRTITIQEADYWIDGHQQYSQAPLAIKHNALFYGAGIDESNSDGYYTLLPEHPHASAKAIWQWVRDKHEVDNLGVVITDSHSLPLRWGVSGIAIGWYGFEPLQKHVGKHDLFGREIKLSCTNLVDSIAAGAAVVCGEADECTPLVIARNIPNLTYTEENTSDGLFVSPADDLYYPLLKQFYEDRT